MLERAVPEWLRHPPAGVARTPSARAFATLSGIEALVRGTLLSVLPLALYSQLGDARTVSAVYLAVGVTSLVFGLLLPWINRVVPRRWLYTFGAGLYVLGCGLGSMGGLFVIPALLFCTLATVTCFVCLNAYVLDYIAKVELGRTETLRMFYSAFAWSAGPVTGVLLWQVWAPAPFLLGGAFALVLIGVFWWLRLGNGKLIARARAPAPNPLAFLGRFAAQPRLIAGWMFAVLRSCGWWVYIVYLPIDAIENGLPERLGGTAVSLTNALLFTTPLILRWVQRGSVRRAVRTGFLMASAGFLLAGVLPVPVAVVASLVLASCFLILLDVAGGLPFLMAVKPSERTEMAAVYSSFRDVSGILTPGIGTLVLLVAPVQGLFVAAGAGLLAMYWVAGQVHPMLGIAAPLRRSLRPTPP
ncbi:MFS transporter [Pararhodobacter sp. SW119]|uniref:MFS transporter n=1 Tax=Pararhodobacter sp. SW119 TaxID=2780075 RepID=UPI001AE04A15|nr:MFS transporter [Pararhodobacter sp. SW119]